MAGIFSRRCQPSLFRPGGFAPPDPPSPSLAGAPCPAPLRRGACGASTFRQGLRPAGPPIAVARGGPVPAPLRRAPAAPQRLTGGAPTPIAVARGAPPAPLRRACAPRRRGLRPPTHRVARGSVRSAPRRLRPQPFAAVRPSQCASAPAALAHPAHSRTRAPRTRALAHSRTRALAHPRTCAPAHLINFDESCSVRLALSLHLPERRIRGRPRFMIGAMAVFLHLHG